MIWAKSEFITSLDHHTHPPEKDCCQNQMQKLCFKTMKAKEKKSNRNYRKNDLSLTCLKKNNNCIVLNLLFHVAVDFPGVVDGADTTAAAAS